MTTCAAAKLQHMFLLYTMGSSFQPLPATSKLCASMQYLVAWTALYLVYVWSMYGTCRLHQDMSESCAMYAA